MQAIQATTTVPDSPLFFSLIIIDDSTSARMIAERCCEKVLEKNGFEFSIRFADNGNDGWNLCNAKPYMFYVVDKEMPGMQGEIPGMQGPEVCEKILEKFPEAAVVLFSAADPYEIKRARLPEKVKVIPKEDIEMLAAYLEDLLMNLRINSSAGRKNSSLGEKG